jgi:DNA-binding transcriptional LysR family regulator
MPTSGRPRPWQFEVKGRPIELHPEPRYMADDGEGLLRMAAAGLALVQAPDYMARAGLASGELEEVLAPFAPEPLPISIVFPSNRHVPLRLRLLVDALVALDLAKQVKRGGKPRRGRETLQK